MGLGPTTIRLSPASQHRRFDNRISPPRLAGPAGFTFDPPIDRHDGGHRLSPRAAIGSPHGRPLVLPTGGHWFSPRAAIGSPHRRAAVSRSGDFRKQEWGIVVSEIGDFS